MNDDVVDVIIAGGGPAGAATAFTLGKLGIETILMDKKPLGQIGDKVCGDALSPRYPEQAANMIEGFPQPDPNNGELQELCDIVAIVADDQRNKLKLASNSATVDRLKYGQKLIRSLDIFPHVKVMSETRILDIIINDGHLEGVICQNKSGRTKITSKIVIDATGSSEVIRKKFPDTMCTKFEKRTPTENRYVAYREIIRTPEPHKYQKGLYITSQPELEELGAAYYWYFSRGPKELNIGLGYLITEENKKYNIRKLNDQVRERVFPDAEIVQSRGDQIPCRLPLPSCVHNGFMAVGDAAGLANPLNGEGHGPALISGVQAAKFAAKAVENNSTTEDGLWDYNRWIWNKYGVQHSWGIAVVKFINKYGPEIFDYLLETGLFQENDILIMINEPNKNIPLWKRIPKGWRRPKVLWDLYKVKNQAKNIQKLAINYPDKENFSKWYMELKKLENYYLD